MWAGQEKRVNKWTQLKELMTSVCVALLCVYVLRTGWHWKMCLIGECVKFSQRCCMHSLCYTISLLFSKVGEIWSFFFSFFVNGMCKYMYISRYEIKFALMVVFCKITKNHLEVLSSVCRRKLLTVIKLYFVTCYFSSRHFSTETTSLISWVITSSHTHSVLYHQYHLML